MTQSKLLPIGATVTCEDGECGVLHQLVVDPLAGTVTHLVIEPAHRRGAGRLVPVGLISPAVPEVRLDCTLAEFAVLEPAEDSQFLPGAPASWGLGSEQVAFRLEIAGHFEPDAPWLNAPIGASPPACLADLQKRNAGAINREGLAPSTKS